MNAPEGWPANRPTEQPIEQLTDQPPKQSVEWSAERPTERLTVRLAERLTARLAGQRVERLAEWLVVRAARRWPADISEILADEWRSEIRALRADARLGPAVRAWRMLSFAGSLAFSPAVEAEGEEAVSRFDSWSRPLAAAAGVTLLAASLFNGVHTAQHALGARLPQVLNVAATLAALAVAATVMAMIGTRSRAGTTGRTVLVGGALFAFLLAGNRVAVMPFMGWADVLPAVAVWTLLTATTAWATTRLRASRPTLSRIIGIGGGLITVDLATAAGSAHAAGSLGLGPWSAPGWFPLALLPGGTVTFGPHLANGSSFGVLQATGQPFHASDILLGNASAMAGPLLLSSAFIIALALRPARVPTARPATRIDLRIPLGVGATLAGLAICEFVRRLDPAPSTVTLHRILDNSTTFGFGFTAHTPGRIATALVAGLLAAHLAERARTPAA